MCAIMSAATTDSVRSEESDSYIALIPRGLHHVFVERLKRKLQESDGGYSMSEVHFVGERNAFDEKQYQQHLSELLLKRKRQHSKRIGTVKDPWMSQHVSVGYDCSGNTVFSYQGNAAPIWACFSTTAPVDFISKLRFIGPLLASVQVWEGIDLDDTKSLEQIETLVRSLDFSSEKLDVAVKLWHAHVQDSWPLVPEELKDIHDKILRDNVPSLSYRLSCVRAQSKHYSYTREQFVRAMADYVVPKERPWKVDLSNYNIEVVLLVQSKCLAAGLALRPYLQLKAKSFDQGTIPPDVTPPYLSGNVLSGLVRLRPTTAQLLWGLLDLSPGDVVLDPCAGIGTIPLEVPNGVFGLGGDLILNNTMFRPLAAEYARKMRQHNESCKSDLLAWDAAMLPLRTSCVDAVVSDLPFGQQCLSTAKLDVLLPLILGEISRVLRPGGSMVLLCGAFPSILDTLDKLNELQPEGAVWELPCDAVFPVNIGGLVAWIIKVKRGPADVVHVPKHTARARKLVSKRELVEKAHRKDSRGATKHGGLKYRRLQK